VIFLISKAKIDYNSFGINKYVQKTPSNLVKFLRFCERIDSKSARNWVMLYLHFYLYTCEL